MPSPVLSVILPTHHRPEILRTCLEHLSRQTIAKDLEVIVVHDGEDDEETRAVLRGFACHGEVRDASASSHEPSREAPQDDTEQRTLPFPLHYSAIPKSQQGVARNRGAQKATGDIVLFIQDDIFLEPEACEAHVRAHASHELPVTSSQNDNWKLETGNWKLNAVLGFTRWDPSLAITPVMRWLDKTGWQFGYRFLAPFGHGFVPRAMQHRFTYASHISLPRSLALRFPFREDVALYGWEDIEWGWRMALAGVPLFYEPNAKALHHHRITLAQSLQRMETLGRSGRFFEERTPGLRLLPHRTKLQKYRLLSLLPNFRGAHARALLKGMKHDASAH